VSIVQENAGVVPGRIQDDDATVGASRGACAFRLIPSFEKHDNKATHHPTRRPPSATIKNMTQFHDIQKILKRPSIDGQGKALKLSAPVGIHRPPTATPRSQRFRRAVGRSATHSSTHADSAEISLTTWREYTSPQDCATISSGGQSVESSLSVSSLHDISTHSDSASEVSPRSRSHSHSRGVRSPSRSPGSPVSLKSRESSGIALNPASPSIYKNAPPVGQ